MQTLGPLALVDGKLVPTHAARLPAMGGAPEDGLFETVLVLPAAPGLAPSARLVALDLHLARLTASLAAHGQPAPASTSLAADAARLVAASEPFLCAPRALRLVVTPTSVSMVLRAVALERRFGLHLHRVAGARVAPRHKTLAWRAVEVGHPAGHDPRFEGVWLDGDVVLEGNTSNLAIVAPASPDDPGAPAREAIVTAPLALPILPGVGRARALAAARALGLPVVERPFTWSELVHAREAFATSALLGVAPIIGVEGAPKDEGPVTRALRQMLA